MGCVKKGHFLKGIARSFAGSTDDRRSDSNPALPLSLLGTHLGGNVGETWSIFNFIFILLSSQAGPPLGVSALFPLRFARRGGAVGGDGGSMDGEPGGSYVTPGSCTRFLYLCIPPKLVLPLHCNNNYYINNSCNNSVNNW